MKDLKTNIDKEDISATGFTKKKKKQRKKMVIFSAASIEKNSWLFTQCFSLKHKMENSVSQISCVIDWSCQEEQLQMLGKIMLKTRA